MKKAFRKVLKIFAWVLGGIVFLLLLTYILIQVPAVQDYGRKKIVAYLEEKIKTKVEIKKLSIAFPKRIVLEGVYFEDEKKDTLLYGKELRVDIALFKLLSNEVNVQYISLDGIRANIYRINPDTVFNYGYIVKAFAGEQEKKPQPADSTSAMKFNVGKIVLKNISASFKDDATGNNANLYLGNIETEIKTFDPDHLVFNIKSFNADNIDVRFHQYESLVHLKTDSAAVQQIADTSSVNPSVEIGNIAFKQAHFNYLNDATAMLADIDIGEFITHPSSINLKNLFIALKDIQLNNTTAKITIGKTSKTVKDIVEADPTTDVWKFEIAKTQFSNNHLIYDDSTNPKAASGMDYSHLNIDNLSLDADNFIFTPTEYTGSINNLSFREQRGFYLQKLQTNFLYNDTSAYLKNILVQTDKTILKNNIEIRYHSVKALSEKPGDVYVNATLEHSSIAVKDILTFAPMLAANFKGSEQAVLQLNTIVQGYVKDLSIPAFQLSGLGNTYANVSGTIKGLPDAANAVYNLKIAKLAATKKDIINFIPPKTLSSSRLPETFAITGFFNGSAKAFNTKLLLQTSKGNIDATASMSPNENYNVKAALQNVDAGYLLKQDTLLGKLNMLVIAKGNGFDVKKGNADYNIAVSSAEIKNYNYRNVQVDGNLRNGILNTTANMQDSNITFNLDATANLQNKYPAVQMQLLVDTINLHALHLITDTISMHANIIADIASANPDSLNGQIIINDISVAAQGRNLHTDSIMVRSAAQGMQDSLHIYAGGMLTADLNGSYQLTAIGQSLMATINKYYNLPGADTLQNLPEQNFEFAAKIISGDLLLQFLPELKGSDSIIMNASYKTATNKLEAALKANKIIYGTKQADSLTLIAKTNNDHLDFGLSLQDAKSSSFTLYRTSLNGFIANNQADFSLNIQDQKNKTQYNIAGLLSQAANGVKFNLKPGALVLNYDEWTAAADNFIQYDSIGLLAHNFNISSQGQSLTINSNPQQSNAPLTAAFNNFKIGTLTKIADQTSLNIDGNINGNLVIKDATKNAVFTSDLNLSNLTYNNDTLGNMLVQVNNEQANAFAAHIAMEGKGNDVKLDGMYYTGESRMDFKLNMQQLNLALAKPFAAGQLTDIKGVLQGNIHITGTTALPAVNGDLNFKDAFITPAALGEEFKLSDEKIAIDQQGIHFNNFTLLDSASNEAVINGDILTADFKNFNFAVDLDAEDFVLVNAKQSTNKSFYGKLNVTANIKTRGSLESLKTDADIRINKETDFTFVLPGENPEIQERKGVVEFVDKDHPEDTLGVTYITDTLIARTEMKGMDVSATIETDSSAQFTLVIDERNGDALTLKGRSDLAGGIDKSGKLSLTGNYELQHGSYQVSLTVLKRKFDIQRGSTIIWTGDPTKANVDIIAVYTASTSPLDLVQTQLSGRSQAEINAFKEKLPFQVLLKMQGELLKPVITFDIMLPEDELSQWPDVDAKLQQVRADESELNKQVFALLLLNRFVSENPFVSAAGGGSAESIARQSASRILTDQLNQLAGSLIKGVNLTFDINSEEDYTTGTETYRTDLNVGLSKSLLNDRLVVYVGSNFELEGPSNSNRSASNIAGDVAIDYKVSQDGRYKLRAYRKNQYEGVIEGEVIETGVSFILTFDYNHFKELFETKKINKQVRRANKEKKRKK